MKKFNFKLESVLKYRKTLADQAKDELAKAHKSRDDSEQALTEAIEKEGNHREVFKEDQKKQIIDIHSMLAHLRYLAHLVGDKRHKQRELFQKEKELENKRRIYVEKSRDKKAMEKLKEKKKSEYLRETMNVEQKVIDESAVMRHSRKEKGDEKS